jgi:hypothetical protein
MSFFKPAKEPLIRALRRCLGALETFRLLGSFSTFLCTIPFLVHYLRVASKNEACGQNGVYGHGMVWLSGIHYEGVHG